MGIGGDISVTMKVLAVVLSLAVLVSATLAQGQFQDPSYMGPPAGAAMPQQSRTNPLLKAMLFRNMFDMNMMPALMMSNMMGGGSGGMGGMNMLWPAMMMGAF